MREGVESIMNPDDRHALEAAIHLKETLGGRVTALSMGPPQSVDVISEALGMGADEGILLSDSAFAGADTWATSTTLGRAIEKVGNYDVVFCGRQAIDGDTAQIGPQVAECLKIPQLSYVFAIESITKKRIVVKRRVEDGYERVECRLPALLSVIAELNIPRQPVVGRLLDACREKAPIRVWNAADIGVMTRDVGLEGSLTHVIKTFAPKSKRAGEMLEGDVKAAVGALVGRMKGAKLI
jgi:electron transfer flavoprotein beta subunit